MLRCSYNYNKEKVSQLVSLTQLLVTVQAKVLLYQVKVTWEEVAQLSSPQQRTLVSQRSTLSFMIATPKEPVTMVQNTEEQVKSHQTSPLQICLRSTNTPARPTISQFAQALTPVEAQVFLFFLSEYENNLNQI